MGQHRAHLGPLGPRRAPCWPHEPCYQGSQPRSKVASCLKTWAKPEKWCVTTISCCGRTCLYTASIHWSRSYCYWVHGPYFDRYVGTYVVKYPLFRPLADKRNHFILRAEFHSFTSWKPISPCNTYRYPICIYFHTRVHVHTRGNLMRGGSG